jgi:DNA-binding transcriptional ArsR family regulator
MPVDLQATLTAVADPSRRRLLARLAQGPATTGQLADLLPMSRPAVSQHLRLLQDAGLVRTTAHGRHRWHELATDPLLEVVRWAGALAARGDEAPAPRTAGSTAGTPR